MRSIFNAITCAVQERLYAPALMWIGKRLYHYATIWEGPEVNEDRLVPSLRRLEWEGYFPQIQETCFVAPNATVIGNVNAGEDSSIWYGSVLIGVQGIDIGKKSIIQDRVHISQRVKIGNNVFVGPNCVLQGSTLKDWAFVSMGASVKRALVETGGFVAAGAVVNDNDIVKNGQIWAGNPARFLRKVTPLEREVLREHHEDMVELSRMHNQQTEKPFRTLLMGKWAEDRAGNLEYFMDHLDRLQIECHMTSQDDEEFLDERLTMKHKITYPEFGGDYEPYRFDHAEYSQKFRVGIHEEQFAKIATRLQPKTSFDNDTEPWGK